MRMVDARCDTSTTVLPSRCSCSDFKMTARAEDQYVLAYPALPEARGGSAWTEGPVIV